MNTPNPSTNPRPGRRFSRALATLAVASLLVSGVSVRASVLVYTDFTSTSQGIGFSDSWTTSSLFGNGTFGSSGFDTVQNYFLTTRGVSGISLSATPTWVALQSTLESYTVPGSSAFFDFRLQMAGDTTSNISMGANANASPFTLANWGAIFRNGGSFQGIYPGGVAAPAGPNTFLVRLTSDGANVSMQAWRYGASLPTNDPTGAINGAAQYGSWTWTSAGTGISGLRVEGNLNTLSTSLFMANNYYDIASDKYYWTANGSTLGGTGTWSASNTNWSPTTSPVTGSTWFSGKTAVFTNAPDTVTVDTITASAGLQFSTDGYTLTGGTLTLGGATSASNTVTVGSGVGATVNTALAGSAGMTKAGGGTLTLAGTAANTLTGTTVVAAGTLQLNKTAGTTAVAGAVRVESGATLLLSASDQVTNTSAVTLSGGTIQRSAGVSETFGNLNLLSASFLDYGTGATGTLEFGTYTPTLLLTVQNFSEGNVLKFGNNVGAFLPTGGALTNSYFSFNNAFTYDSGTFTITAIPEPSAVLAALALIGLMLTSVGRRRTRAGAQSAEIV